MLDLSDAQTQAFVRTVAAMPAPSAASATLPAATDGATLESQPTGTRLAFISAYGSAADQQWVDEHNSVLTRSAR